MAFPDFLRITSLSKFRTMGINKTYTNEDILNGVDVNLVELLASALRFSYELVSPSDGEYGRLLPGGKWSGLVGMVERGEADLIIHYLAVTEERTSVIDFSTPYAINRYAFATNPEYGSSDITSFLLPFSYEVWYCVLIYVIIKIFTAYVLRNFKIRHETGRSRSPLQKSRHGRRNLLAAIYVIGDMFLRYSYAAVLLACLTFPSETGVRTASELSRAVQKSTHQCASHPGSYIVPYFLSSNDSNLKIFGQSMSKYEGSPHVEEALKTSNSALKIAYFSVESTLHSLNTEYSVSEDTFLHSMRAIGLKKDFCCKARLDAVLHYVWASGIYGKFVGDAAFKISLRNSKTQAYDASYHRSLSSEDFEGVFILLFAGYALAVLVLIIENVKKIST